MVKGASRTKAVPGGRITGQRGRTGPTAVAGPGDPVVRGRLGGHRPGRCLGVRAPAPAGPLRGRTACAAAPVGRPSFSAAGTSASWPLYWRWSPWLRPTSRSALPLPRAVLEAKEFPPRSHAVSLCRHSQELSWKVGIPALVGGMMVCTNPEAFPAGPEVPVLVGRLPCPLCTSMAPLSLEKWGPGGFLPEITTPEIFSLREFGGRCPSAIPGRPTDHHRCPIQRGGRGRAVRLLSRIRDRGDAGATERRARR